MLQMNLGAECPICKKKLIEHSELQDKISEMITIKQFANNSPGSLPPVEVIILITSDLS